MKPYPCDGGRHPRRRAASSALRPALLAGFVSLASAGPTHAQAAPEPAAPRASVAPQAMQAVAPALADYTDAVLFGDVWLRPELSPRDRSLVTVSVLIATGKPAQLTGHLGRALDNGLTPGEVAGIVTHLAFYAGWPNAVSSLDVVEKVLTDRKVDLAALRRRSEPAPARPDDPAQARMVEAAIGKVAPKLAQLTSGVIRDDLWRRNDLSPRDRSLVTIAALAANGDDGQLGAYIERGLENGLTRAQVGEAFTHLAFYAGWPRATAAVALASEVFAGSGGGGTSAGPALRVFPPGASPATAPPTHFTGSATVTSPFKATGTAAGGATVTFRQGAHTNWHTHPRGQLLIVTGGTGWVQAAGGPVRLIRAGDVVWTAPGVKHWHGATRTSGMTHVAVSESVDGQTVTWLEPVAESDYHGPVETERKD